MSKDNVVTKSFTGFEIKDAEKGLIKAVIATLGVVDKDEDVITADAIKSGAKVTMSCYGHDAVYGNLPAGKGALSIDGNSVVFDGKAFLSTSGGRDAFEVLKEMGADQEWSFGFKVMGSEVPDDAWKKKGARRMLTKLDCFEVSPVLRGAGVNTRTLAVKSEETVPDPAIEAARLETERKEKEQAETLRIDTERKAKEAAENNEYLTRRFGKPPAGVK